MKDTEGAFKWIISILEKHTIPYQISGGFAARLYGATRELADIDIEVPNNSFDTIREEVSKYVTYGPEQYVDENWDLLLMTIEYKGQLIDISGEATMYDQYTKGWMKSIIDFNRSNMVTIYGISVPVIPKEELIAYKKKLGRAVDLEDVQALTA